MLPQLPGTVALMLDAAWRVGLLLAVAWCITRLLGRQPAAVRHAVWAAAFAAALLLPMIGSVAPAWNVAVLPAGDTALAVLPSTTPTPPSRPAPAPAPAVRPPVDKAVAAAQIDHARGRASNDRETAGVARPASTGGRRTPADWAGLLWAAIAAIVLGRYFASIASVRWLVRGAEPVHDLRWRDATDVAAAELGLTRTPAVLASEHVTVPFTSGILRPVVVVPFSALDRWSDERVRVVLLHELAHVRRRDCLVQALTQLACAAYWFNPMTWIAARRLRAERERACDDLVLQAGLRGADYAQHLLDIARTMSSRRSLSAAALAMARPTELEGRLLSILDAHRRRRAGAGTVSWRSAACMVALAMPVATLQPVAREATAGVASDPAFLVGSPAADRQVAPVGAAEARSLDVETRTSGAATAKIVARATAVGQGIARTLGAAAADDADAVIEGIVGGIAGGIEGGVPGGVEGGIAGGVAGGIATALQGQGSVPVVADGTQASEKRTASPAVIAGLTEALKDPDADVRKSAMQALQQLGAPIAYETLVAALKDEDVDLRSHAAFSLGQMGDSRAVSALAAALKDSEADVRQQAAFALGQLNATEAIPALRGALKDESEDVREQALFALSQMGDKASVPAITEALKDESEDVRQQALFALSQLGDASAVPAILPLLAGDESEDVRQQAAFALSQIGDDRAIDALTAALKDPSADVRSQAVFALSQLAGGDDRPRRGPRKTRATPTPKPTPTPTPSPTPAPVSPPQPL